VAVSNTIKSMDVRFFPPVIFLFSTNFSVGGAAPFNYSINTHKFPWSILTGFSYFLRLHFFDH
jgi:hypothetical protein